MPKINQMLKELYDIKKELIPDEKDVAREQAHANMDEWQKLKYDLNHVLKELRGDIDRLADLRKSTPDGRDITTIRLGNENSKKLKEAGVMWGKMKELVIRDEKKKKLDEKTIFDRKKNMTILAKELQELSDKNSHVGAAKKTETQKEMEGKREERARKRREQREKRDAARRDRGGKKGDINEDDIDEAEMRPVAPLTAQEQAFMEEVEQNKQQEDAMLDEVLRGMTELKEIAQDMNAAIKVGSAMADQIGTKLDDLNEKFKTANAKLQDILEESGGLSRWCPMLICIVLLLGLAGYIFNVVT